MFKNILSTFLLSLITLLVVPPLNSQVSSSIIGKVTDSETGDALIGCNVILEGIGIGAATDMDGYFHIRNIPPGTYNIIISYIGYKTYKISGFKVNPRMNYRLDITLDKTDLKMENVVVEAKIPKTSGNFTVTQKQTSTGIFDGITSELISLSSDGNAADAAKRICGVSVIDGKYANIRGMGERYLSIQVNGISVPSPEPEKKVVPLDIFPSQIIENVLVNKTYTPDQPGTFGGGNINIKTKAYPDNRVFNISFSTQIDESMINIDKFYVDHISTTDIIGFDNGKRALPDKVPQDKLLSLWSNELSKDTKERLNILGHIGKSFLTEYSLQESKSYRPLSFVFSLGNRYSDSNKIEYGFFFNTAFSGKTFYNNECKTEYSLQNGKLKPRLDMNIDDYGYKTNMAITFSTGIKLFSYHKISLFSLYTHQSNNSTEIAQGFADNFDDGIFLKKHYIEKSILNNTITGEHSFKLIFRNTLSWHIAFGKSHFYEPDLRRVNYRRKVDPNGNYYYQMDLYSWSVGTREFSEGTDSQFELNLDYLTSFKVENKEYKFKVGYYHLGNFRNFGRRSFYHKYAGEYSISVIPPELAIAHSIDELGTTFTDSNYFYIDENGEIVPGLIIVENTGNHDAYESKEKLYACYILMDIPIPHTNFMRIVSGFRFENYSLNLTPYNPVTKEKFYSNILDDTVTVAKSEKDYLPSINLILTPTEKIKINLGFSKTLGRPQFRELAPFEFQALYGGEIVVGYPFLKTTEIKNYDLRIDWFKSAGEIISVGLFYKKLVNPIETALLEASGKYYKTYQNTHHAENIGMEFDSRIRFDILPAKLGILFLNTNFTYIHSTVTVNPTISIFTGYEVKNQATSKVRPLQGNSNLMVNVNLEYKNSHGYVAGLSFNTFSNRLYSLGVGGIPDKYQLPFYSLNTSISKRYGKLKLSMKIKNVLDSQVKYGHVDTAGNFAKTRSHKPGRIYSFSIGYQL